MSFMSIFGKKFNTPVLKPMMPFILAGGIVYYGIDKFAQVLANSEEYRNDPRNPRAGRAAH